MNDTYLVVDIDNVIARTDEVMRDVIKKHSINHVDFSYEDIINFDYAKCVDQKGNRLVENEWRHIHDEFSKEVNICRIAPYTTVQTHLSNLEENGYKIHLVTSRLREARKPTISWLNEHDIPHQGLHFVKHRCKHLIFQNCAGVIEDDLEQAREFSNLKIPTYLLAHPWNNTRTADSITRAQNWDEIVEKLVRRSNTTGICLNVAN